MRRSALEDASAPPADADAPSHVIVLATLEAPPPRPRLGGRRGGSAQAEPGPGWLSRATVIDVGVPLSDADASGWLRGAGEPELETGLAVLNWALHAYRLAAADARLTALDRRQAVAARVGYGAGEQVANGEWTDSRELPWLAERRSRRRMLTPEGRLAAMLTGRDRALAGEELTLRARHDLDTGRERLAALQLLIALDTTIAELSNDPVAGALAARLEELRGHREPVAAAAQAALTHTLDDDERAAVAAALERVEAALRARAAGRG